MSQLFEGGKVHWARGNGTGTCTIIERFTQDATRKIKGSDIKRKASDGCPA